MTDLRRKRRAKWVGHLTGEERAEIAAIDARLAVLRDEAGSLSRKRYIICNRATQRAKR